MSFAKDVKNEIANLDLCPLAFKAELYGIVKLKSNLIISKRKLALEFVMSSLSLARRIVFLFRKVYNLNLEFLVKEQRKLDYKNLNYLTAQESVKEILLDLQIIDEDFNFIRGIPNIYRDYKDSVLRGMFLARGSVNDPAKSNYHLEIVCNNKEECDYIIDLLKSFDIEAKTLTRSRGEIVYLKKAEAIADFLKIVGASNMLFYYENERIKRDLNNVVNRVMNCDLANSDKTLKAATEQISDIELIDKHLGLDTLSFRLFEIAKLRLTHQDASLTELSELSEETIGRYLSKSGISHGLQDLKSLAKSIKETKNET